MPAKQKTQLQKWADRCYGATIGSLALMVILTMVIVLMGEAANSNAPSDAEQNRQLIGRAIIFGFGALAALFAVLRYTFHAKNRKQLAQKRKAE